MGCRSTMFSFIRSFRKIFAERDVSVIVGAMALMRTTDANSAPNDFTNPSTPALAVAMLA
ncbi:hypothetical protein D3C72_1318790 [compost metagenome]